MKKLLFSFIGLLALLVATNSALALGSTAGASSTMGSQASGAFYVSGTDIYPIVASSTLNLNDLVVSGSITSGGISFTGNLDMGGYDITNADQIIGNSAAVTIGDAGSTSNSLAADDDLFVSGKLEVDGFTYFDDVVFMDNSFKFYDGRVAYFGDSNDVRMSYNTTQTPDALFLGLSADSRNLIISEAADSGIDFSHAQQTNPSIWLHSADATDLNDYILLQHDQSKAVMTTATGNIQLNAPDGLTVLDSDVQAMSITNDGTVSTLIPASGDYTRIGDAVTTAQGLNSEDDLLVTGDFEVGGSVILNGNLELQDGKYLGLGTASDAKIEWNTWQTPDTLTIEPDNVQSNSVLIIEDEDRNFDFAHALQTNPTVFVHSANQATDEWISLAHDQTNGVISTGTGSVSFPTGVKIGTNGATSGVLTWIASDNDQVTATINTSDNLAFAGASGEYTFDNNIGATGTIYVNDAAGSALLNEAATTTNPTLVPNRAENDTGIGWASDVLHLVLGGANEYSFSTSTAQFNSNDIDGQYIVLDPTPTTDDTGEGFKASVTVDTNATGVGSCLYMASDGHYDTTDADAAATMPCSAIALETSTGTKDVLLQGYMRNDGWNWTTVGGLIYVSTATGELTQTAPSGASDVVQIVGYATSADEIYFTPNLITSVIAS